MKTLSMILEEITPIFRDVLENDDITVTETTTAEDIPEWDSLAHIHLVVGIEKHFKIRFTSGEIDGFKNVGEMSEGIIKKLAAK